MKLLSRKWNKYIEIQKISFPSENIATIVATKTGILGKLERICTNGEFSYFKTLPEIWDKMAAEYAILFKMASHFF